MNGSSDASSLSAEFGSAPSTAPCAGGVKLVKGRGGERERRPGDALDGRNLRRSPPALACASTPSNSRSTTASCALSCSASASPKVWRVPLAVFGRTSGASSRESFAHRAVFCAASRAVDGRVAAGSRGRTGAVAGRDGFMRWVLRDLCNSFLTEVAVKIKL